MVNLLKINGIDKPFVSNRMKPLLWACLYLNIASSGQAQQDAQTQKSGSVYRMDFAIRDNENGQKTNLRRFTMLAEEKSRARVNTGTRIPYLASGGNFH